MINHISIGVKDINAARRFYEATFKPLGYKCMSESASALGYGDKAAQFWIYAAEKPVPANHQSGLHFCFDAPSRESVAAFHAAALSTGGRDNGAPGLRADYGDGYYAAFVVDPDGYRIEAYHQG